MTRWIGLALLTSLSAIQAAPPLLTVPESSAVYAAILPHEWPARIAKAKRLVIAEETVTFKRCKPDLPKLSRSEAA
jgi:hypothetical protein